MREVELHHGAATDVGRVREVNEDAHLAVPPVYAVADGMGGHEGGDVASAIAVEEFGRLAEAGYDRRHAREAVAATLQEAQRRILEYAGEQARRGVAPWRSAGTTVVAALLVEGDDGPAWLLANLGDSRIYRFSEGRLVQVSTDHSLVQELLDAGRITPEEVATHPERNVITRALGDAVGVEADYFVVPLADAERILLCTDGVSGMLDDAAIAAVLAEAADPRDAADRLVAAAVAAGGEDNATAIVVDVVGTVADDSYDAERQRASLEEKLGRVGGARWPAARRPGTHLDCVVVSRRDSVPPPSSALPGTHRMRRSRRPGLPQPSLGGHP
jgi:PPM family protein phosphatase